MEQILKKISGALPVSSNFVKYFPIMSCNLSVELNLILGLFYGKVSHRILLNEQGSRSSLLNLVVKKSRRDKMNTLW